MDCALYAADPPMFVGPRTSSLRWQAPHLCPCQALRRHYLVEVTGQRRDTAFRVRFVLELWHARVMERTEHARG